MKFFFTGFFVLLSVLKISAQTKAVTDTARIEDDKYSSLTIGTSYGNTANYYGQTTAERLPYTSINASYNYKNGLWTSVSALKLLTSGSGISETSVSAGYDFDITKKLGGSFSYTRFFFAKNSPLPQSVNPNNVSANLSYNWKWFNTGLYGDYVFGNFRDSSVNNKLNDFFLTFNASKEIDLGSFTKKDYITITPSIQLTGGTQRLGRSSSEAAEIDNPNLLQPIARKNERTGTIFQRNRRTSFISPEDIQKLKLPRGDKSKGETSVVQSTTFDLVTTNFRLPLAYNRAHYTVEAAYQLSVPNRNFEGIVHENQSYFTLSFFYLFFKDKP